MKNNKTIIIVLILLLIIFLIQKITTIGDPKSDIVEPKPLTKEDSIFKNVPYETISKEYYGGINKKGYYVIKSQREWSDLWKASFSIVFPQPSVPVIDFKEDMLIAVFAGEFSSGGYSTEITKLEGNLRTLNVAVENISPGSNCVTTAALTQPFHIIKTKKIDKEIKFNEVNKIDNCD